MKDGVACLERDLLEDDLTKARVKDQQRGLWLVCVAGYMSRESRSDLEAGTSARQWSDGVAKAEA